MRIPKYRDKKCKKKHNTKCSSRVPLCGRVFYAPNQLPLSQRWSSEMSNPLYMVERPPSNVVFYHSSHIMQITTAGCAVVRSKWVYIHKAGAMIRVRGGGGRAE